MRTFSLILCSLAAAWCVTSHAQTPAADPAPQAERRGPQITPREAVDWAPLNAVVEIRLQNLRLWVTEREGSRPPVTQEVDDAFTRQTILKVFPAQKLVTLQLSPGQPGNCQERGEFYEMTFVASPGAEVSDRISCEYQGPTKKNRTTASYQTTSKFAAGTLTLDGKARMQLDSLDTYKGGDQAVNAQANMEIELHGAIQITDGTCQVVAWRHTAAQQVRNEDGSRREVNVKKEIGPDMACTVTKK